MRVVGHKVNRELLSEEYQDIREELDEFPGLRTEELKNSNPNYFRGYVESAIEAGRVGYALGVSIEEIVDVLRRALRELPVVLELGGTLNPGKMRDFLGVALLAADPKILKWMAHLPRDSYSDAMIEFSEAAYLLVEAMQAGARKDANSLSTAVKKFRAVLTPKKLIVDPRGEKALFEPLAALLESIAAADQQTFDHAWKQEALAWKKRYGRESEAANWDGLLDVVALGMGRIAQNFGLAVPSGNPYAPPELLGTNA